MFPTVRLIHIFVSGPLLIWIGLTEPKSVWVYKMLFALGALMLLAFGVKILLEKTMNAWYVIHAALFSLLLLYAGYTGLHGGHAVPRVTFGLLLSVGIAAFGYHLVRLIQAMKK